MKEEFSFTFSSNGISIIPVNRKKEEKENEKIILFACKKYLKNQKNGILLINYNKNKFTYDKNINYYFYNTGNFEVYCFCPILLYKKEANKSMCQDIYYFLVGGFESNKKRGSIKLYKINYDKESLKDQIEYIQDIIYDHKYIHMFKGPISSIIQSSKDGSILITCWDGNVYLLDIDMEYYIKYDAQVKNKELYEKFFF